MRKLLLCFFCAAMIAVAIRHSIHADGINANTVDTNLVLQPGNKPALALSTRVIVGFGAGNWTTVNLDPARKYYVYNYGFDHTGAVNTYRVKCAINSSAEPDAGGAVTFTSETNTDIIQVGVAIYPIKGVSAISLKAETGEAMIIVRTIETFPNEQ